MHLETLIASMTTRATVVKINNGKSTKYSSSSNDIKKFQPFFMYMRTRVLVCYILYESIPESCPTAVHVGNHKRFQICDESWKVQVQVHL